MKMLNYESTIKRLRLSKSLTLSELSRRSGVNLSILSRMENNKKISSMDYYSDLPMF